MNPRLHHPRLHRSLLAALCLLLAGTAGALSVVQRSFDELVALSELVLVGTVSELRSAYSGPEQNSIHTYVTLTDLEVVKGTLAETHYTLRTPGGRVGDRLDVHPGLPQLRPGGRYVLFVRGNFRDFFPVVGIYQGVYQVLRDGAGREVVLPATSGEGPNALAAAQQPGAQSETLKGFLQRVRDKLGAAGGAAR